MANAGLPEPEYSDNAFMLNVTIRNGEVNEENGEENKENGEVNGEVNEENGEVNFDSFSKNGTESENAFRAVFCTQIICNVLTFLQSNS